MNNADRYKLLFGPYRAPRFRVGQAVRCEVRGEARLVGLSEGRIPWPVGRLVPTGLGWSSRGW
jgi:hypothetical protein